MSSSATCRFLIAAHSSDVNRIKNVMPCGNAECAFVLESAIGDSDVPKSADVIIFVYSGTSLSSSAYMSVSLYVYDHVKADEMFIYVLDSESDLRKHFFKQIQEVPLINTDDLNRKLTSNESV